MRLQHKWAAGLLGLGLIVAPVLAPAVHGDEAGKDPQKQQGAADGERRRGRGEGRGQGRFLERYQASINALSPTEEQKTKLDALFTEYKGKLEAASKEAGEDRKARREKTRPVMAELRQKVDEVLTAEQKATLAKQREERRQQRGGGKQGGKRDGQKPA